MAKKLNRAWRVLVLACVALVLCLAINAAPVLVHGPARAIVWVAQTVASVLLPSKAHAQDANNRATTVVLYQCEALGRDSVVCSLLAPFKWQDKAVLAPNADGILIGFSLDSCGARMVTLDRSRGLYSSVALASSTCPNEPAVNAVDMSEQW